MKIDPDLCLTPGFMIILRDSLSDLGSGCSDHGIKVGIVVRFAAEDLNSESSLLQMARMPFEISLTHGTTEP